MKLKTALWLGAALALLAVCIVFAFIAGRSGWVSAPGVPAGEEFPSLPIPQTASPGVELYRIRIAGLGPGRPMELNLYLPAGRHQPRSLPCVIIAPAGSGEHGGTIGDDDRPEHWPYVRAGFAVMAYELSGAMANPKKSSYTYG